MANIDQTGPDSNEIVHKRLVEENIKNRRNDWMIALIGAIAIIITPILTSLFDRWFDKLDFSDHVATLAIESIPQNVFVFAGNDKPDGGRGTFHLIYDENHSPIYRMEYSLPDNKYGYAGLVFQFPSGYDVSAYKSVEFTIMFRVPADKIDLFVKDIADNNNTISIAGNGQREMQLSYMFTNFPSINFNAVKEIGIIASTDLAKGDHEVKIKNVRFVK